MGKNLTVHSEWSQEDTIIIRQNLMTYNIKYLSDKDIEFVNEEMSLILKDEDGNIFGGITGSTKMQCLHVQFFWIHESLRGQGFGKKLLGMAEELAIKKNCRLIKIDTFSFQAPEFYKSQGYEVYGEIEDFPEGYTHYYLMKRV